MNTTITNSLQQAPEIPPIEIPTQLHPLSFALAQLALSRDVAALGEHTITPLDRISAPLDSVSSIVNYYKSAHGQELAKCVNQQIYNCEFDDFASEANKVINDSVVWLQTCIKATEKSEKLDGTIFLNLAERLQSERHRIAKKFNTPNADAFGQKRSRISTHIPIDRTGLYSNTQVSAYGDIVKTQVNSLLQNLLQKGRASLAKSPMDDPTDVEIRPIDEKLKSHIEIRLYNNATIESLKGEEPKDLDEESIKKLIGFFINQRVVEMALHLDESMIEYGLIAPPKERRMLIQISTIFEAKKANFELSNYVAWVDYESGIISLKNSEFVILHPNPVLDENTLGYVAKVFAQALKWDRGKHPIKALKKLVALCSYLYAHCMPCSRGDGAISEWIQLILYRYHGFDPRFCSDKMPCYEALCSLDFKSYLDRYDQIITI